MGGTKGRRTPRAKRPRDDARAARTAAAGRGVVRSAYERIYDVVRRIPRGRVLTYGQVAALAGMPGGARVVGYALRASLGAARLPWQRVVGQRRPGLAQVTIRDPIGGAMQRQLLEEEGVELRPDGGIDLERFGWAAPGRRRGDQ